MCIRDRNKGLEVIEAHELFDVDYDRIDVVVHPQSIVCLLYTSSAKADDFIELAQKMADAVLARGPEAVSELNDELDSLKLAKRENIEIGSAVRFEAADGNLLDAYLHVQDGRGVNGVLLEVTGTDDAELAHEVALHLSLIHI